MCSKYISIDNYLLIEISYESGTGPRSDLSLKSNRLEDGRLESGLEGGGSIVASAVGLIMANCPERLKVSVGGGVRTTVHGWFSKVMVCLLNELSDKMSILPPLTTLSVHTGRRSRAGVNGCVSLSHVLYDRSIAPLAASHAATSVSGTLPACS